MIVKRYVISNVHINVAVNGFVKENEILDFSIASRGKASSLSPYHIWPGFRRLKNPSGGTSLNLLNLTFSASIFCDSITNGNGVFLFLFLVF